MAGGERAVIEDAEAEAAIGLGVMARRANQRIGIGDSPLDDRVDASSTPPAASAAISKPPGPKGVSPTGAPSAASPPSPALIALSRLDIGAVVDARQLRRRVAGRGLTRHKLLGQAGDIEQVLDPPLAGRAFRRLVGLDHAAAGLQEARQRSGVVPHQQFVPDESGARVRSTGDRSQRVLRRPRPSRRISGGRVETFAGDAKIAVELLGGDDQRRHQASSCRHWPGRQGRASAPRRCNTRRSEPLRGMPRALPCPWRSPARPSARPSGHRR